MVRKPKTSDRDEALRQVPIFAPCTEAELRELAGLVTEVGVHEGQVLCEEGHFGHECFVILHGSAVATTAAGGRFDLGPGALVGELALLDDGPRTATVTMGTEGTVLAMSGTEFRSLLRAAPTIAVRMLPVLGARLREADAG